MRWRKASRSGPDADCVELGRDRSGALAGVRDSKAPAAGMLAAGVPQLVAAVRDGWPADR